MAESSAPFTPLGFGTLKLKGKSTEAVLNALKLGYRHLDTAVLYKNEVQVGEAILTSKIPRKEIWLTSKVWKSHLKGEPELVKQSCRESLERLQTPYLDLLLLHLPTTSEQNAVHWQALEELQEEGLVRQIGVSNFTSTQLDELLKTARVTPFTNQLELSPFLRRQTTLAKMAELGIRTTAHTPLCKARHLDDPLLQEVAAELKATPAQVMVAWGLTHGYHVIPRSQDPKHQEENWTSQGLKLSEEQMARLDQLEEKRKVQHLEEQKKLAEAEAKVDTEAKIGEESKMDELKAVSAPSAPPMSPEESWTRFHCCYPQLLHGEEE